MAMVMKGMNGEEQRRSQTRGGHAAAVEERVSRWLEALLVDTVGLQPPLEIVINHAALDQSRRVIRSYAIEALPMPAAELCKLIDNACESIVADAEEMSGMQRYQMVASSRRREVGSTTIRCNVDPPMAIDSEPANAGGLVAQAQRHTEAAYRMMVQNNGALFESYQRRLAEQDAMIERLNDRWVELLEAKEKIMSERVALESNVEERRRLGEIETAKEIAELERKQSLFTGAVSSVKMLIPHVVQYLTKGKLAPEAQEELESELYATVTDEQLEQMKARMPPEMFEEYLENVRRARAATAHAGPTPISPAQAAAPAAATATPKGYESPPSSAARIKPLEGEAKLGAAKLLSLQFLPTITKRFAAGEPLIDVRDDLSLFMLFKRLIASTTEAEMSIALGSLPADQEAAARALLEMLTKADGKAGQIA